MNNQTNHLLPTLARVGVTLALLFVVLGVLPASTPRAALTLQDAPDPSHPTHLVGTGVSHVFDTATLAKTQDIGFGQAFVPSTIGPGSTTVLSFSISNTDPAPVSDLAFTDTLPISITLATPASATTTCADATLTAPDGGSSITFSGGRLGADESCTVSVFVTSSIVGMHSNVSGELTSSAGNHGAASASLTVDAGTPGFSKSFSPAEISLGGRSTLTFLINNTANASQVYNLTFVDTLPAGMVVADPANASHTCVSDPYIGGTVTAVPGTSVISIAFDPASAPYGYFAVDPDGTCTISVDVTAIGSGTLVNTSGSLLGTIGFAVVESGIALDVLEATVDPLHLSKSFVNDPVPPGDTVTLEFTITNFDRSDAATDIAFTDDLSDTLSGLVAVGLPLADPCGGGSVLTGADVITLTGGSVPAEEACTFDVTLQVPGDAVSGVYTNTTSSVTANVGDNPMESGVASDFLYVAPIPILTKQFDDPVAAGDTVSLTFTITNTSLLTDMIAIAFIDDLTAFLPYPLGVTLPPGGFCGPGSAMTLVSLGTDMQGLSMTGGSLKTGTSCTFDVLVEVPVGMPGGVYTNTTRQITAIVDGMPVIGKPASDGLTILAAPTLRKTFVNDPVIPGDTVTLTFFIELDANMPITTTDISFTDDLGFVSGLQATDLPLYDVCGAGSMLTGSTSLAFSGGILTPDTTSCVFSTTLQAPFGASSGFFVNTTSDVTATVEGLMVTGNPAQDTLDVAGLKAQKEFVDDPVIPGDTVMLRFTLTNTNPISTVTGINFTDNMATIVPDVITPIGLPLTDPCGAGSQLSQISTLLSFTGGTVAPDSTCTFTVTLQIPGSTPSDTYSNVTSNVVGDLDGDAFTLPPMVDLLTVSSDWLTLEKSFTDDPAAPGDTATLEFTVTNLHATQVVTDVAFADDLDAVLPGLTATGLPANDVCGTGSYITGTSTLELTGGELGPGGSCTFSVELLVPAGAALGAYHNTTGEVTGTIGGLDVRGDPAMDDLLVSSLTFSKSFDGPTFPGDNPVLTFMVQNPSTSTVASDISFSDDINAVISGLVATALPANDVCGLGSLFDGTSFLSLRDASLEPEASCTFSITLQVPLTTSAGSYVNTTSDLLLGSIKASDPATATLTVESLASIGDYVWEDVDQDGIQDGGETGVPDVTVNLRDGTGTIQLHTTTTDASGFYSFTDLLPGDYLVEFVLPADFIFTLQDQGADDAIDSDADPSTGHTITITLVLGENDFSWDAGLTTVTQVESIYLPLVMRNYTPPVFASDLSDAGGRR